MSTTDGRVNPSCHLRSPLDCAGPATRTPGPDWWSVSADRGVSSGRNSVSFEVNLWGRSLRGRWIHLHLVKPLFESSHLTVGSDVPETRSLLKASVDPPASTLSLIGVWCQINLRMMTGPAGVQNSMLRNDGSSLHAGQAPRNAGDSLKLSSRPRVLPVMIAVKTEVLLQGLDNLYFQSRTESATSTDRGAKKRPSVSCLRRQIQPDKPD
jgi:hypothetical protein